MKSTFNRRRFLTRAALATTAFYALPKGRSWAISPNEKLNIGCIGTSGRAAGDIEGVKGENIVALCDVDASNLAKAGEKFPAAKRYADFRRMLDQKDIEAVVCGTPDHTHAVCVVYSMRSGRHVYCEKPLAHTVSEVRIISDTAKKTKRVTQMGNQIHSHPANNYRRVVELIQTKAIGEVREVHVWAGAIYGDKQLSANPPPPPPNLNYDLWLGPVEYMSYRPEYVPFHWRHFWHFGGGTLA
ncbi:MAG: Gfo/Idh/MocA family oxidoreductase, partial [Verrucomicrobia bacterium]|nr:Gfo/Idh/MocA family oxidoreductase [Verrucomicrobiota bacterium]